MTKLNDYLWQLPHTPLDDDPVDISLLQQSFNQPIVDALEEPLTAIGYLLKSSDVMVQLGGRVDNTTDTYCANVRFIAYLQEDIILRVHFEHPEWAHFLPGSKQHRYYINLDRFRVQDPVTQIAVPAWSGRLHTRMSARRSDILHHDGEDQIWVYNSAEDFEGNLQLFLEKFLKLGRPWLEDTGTL